MNTKDLLFDALDRPADERATWLDEACAGDAELHARVESLLAAHAAADERIGTGAPSGDITRQLTAVAGPKIGDRIGAYELVALIGEGGFGSVFHARQEQPVRRDVALKIVKAGMDTAAVLARFEAERQALALMDHPHIARVFEFGATERGRPFFVMERVDGVPITRYAREQGLGRDERLRLFGLVCHALQHAHQKGVVHRDVKPGNVLVAEVDGQAVPKVIDFGIAKALAAEPGAQSAMTAQGHLLGTPAYMSPEQLTGSLDLDTRTDVYALGVLLYELLTGKPPFEVGQLDLTELGALVRDQTPERPSRVLAREDGAVGGVARGVPADLDWIVLRCLEKERERRYPTAFALAGDIERFLAGLPVEAAPPSTWYRVRKLAARHRGLAITGAVVMLALLVAIGGLWAGLDTARRAGREKDAALLRELAEGRRSRELLRFFTEELLESAVPSGEPGHGKDVRVIDVLDLADRRLAAGVVPEDPLAAAALRRSLGRSYSALGQLEPARRLLNQSLESLLELRDPDHPEVLDARYALSGVLLGLGEVGEATRELDRYERDRANAGEPLPVHRLQGEQLRALLLLEDARFDEAVATLERVVDEASELAPLLHLEALDKLGLAKVMLGAHAEAVALFRRAYEGRRERLGEFDPFTLTAQLNVGNSLRAMDRLDEAAPLVDGAVAGLTEVLGAEHPDTLVARLAQVWLALDGGRDERAAGLLPELLEVQRRVLGSRHRDTLETLGASVALALRRGEIQQAETLAREAHAGSLETLGADHPSTWLRANEFAGALFAQDRFDEVAPILRSNLAGQELALGVDHPSTLSSLGNIAVLHLQLGELEQAELALDELLRRHEERPEPLPGRRFAALSNLVGLRGLQGRHEEAAALARRTEEELEASGQQLPSVLVELRFRGAESLHALGELTAALASLERAWELLVQLVGLEDPYPLELAQIGASWCAELEEPESAEQAALWTERLGG